MGGIICRAVLRHINLLKYQLCFMMTLASPHLGITNNQNSLLNLGLNVLTYFKQKDSIINQLMINDQTDPSDSFMYKLSQQATFSLFKQVALVGALEDDYSPYPSSLNLQGQNKSQNIYQQAQDQMQINMESQLEKTQLSRMILSFKGNSPLNISSLIGKKSHLEFLMNEEAIELIITHYDYLFKD